MATISPSVYYIKYNGDLLIRGTKGFELCEKGEYKELEAHLKLLNAAYEKIKGAKKEC
jgi:hypothetical protein